MTPAFDRVRFVMTEPSHPGNVGSAARAIKTMGFSELTLVAPRIDAISIQPEAIALASGANDVLDTAVIHPTLADALAPVTLAQRRRRGRTGEKPLIDTAQMQRSVTHVVRPKGET